MLLTARACCLVQIDLVYFYLLCIVLAIHDGVNGIAWLALFIDIDVQLIISQREDKTEQNPHSRGSLGSAIIVIS